MLLKPIQSPFGQLNAQLRVVFFQPADQTRQEKWCQGNEAADRDRPTDQIAQFPDIGFDLLGVVDQGPCSNQEISTSGCQ
ncbi:MAG: hypothetical protein CM1200mP20_03490 [Pseudomonadota bacterium]|nr:MAG: hypothetical protein CM1200mP20_03490 [Pseudomonadota bacterium]